MNILKTDSQGWIAQTLENSVLQTWVMKLPRRCQGSLVVGLRGCDVGGKPYDPTASNTDELYPERGLTAFLRYCVMNPADEREIDVPGGFFRSKPPRNWKPSQLGHFPLHFYSHLMHSYEIVAYCHPSPRDLLGSISWEAYDIYLRMVHMLHLSAETSGDMLARLTEDRIASNTVVS